MKIELIQQLINQKMSLRNYASFSVLFRELRFKANEALTFKVPGQFWFLEDNIPPQFLISSEMGIYDLMDNRINELQHEHSGTIKMINRSSGVLLLRVVILIPSKRKSYAATRK
jgi:hypothetical protein